MHTSNYINIKTQCVAHLANQALSQPAITTEQAIDEFLRMKSFKGYRTGYLAAMRRNLAELRSTLGRVPIAGITHGQLTPVVFGFAGAPGTRRLKLSVLKTFFRWNRSRGYLPANQLTAADSLHIPIPPSLAWLMKPSELRRLLALSQDPECALWLALSAFTGLRPHELEHLTWNDIFPGACIQIALPPNISPYWRRRTIPMHPALDAWLRPFYGSLGPVMPRRGIRRRVHRLAHLLGLPLRPNILRNSYSAYRFAQTHDLQQVALELGRWSAAFLSKILSQATLTETNEFFALTPETVGLNNWTDTVASYRKQRSAIRSHGKSLRYSRKGEDATV